MLYTNSIVHNEGRALLLRASLSIVGLGAPTLFLRKTSDHPSYRETEQVNQGDRNKPNKKDYADILESLACEVGGEWLFDWGEIYAPLVLTVKLRQLSRNLRAISRYSAILRRQNRWLFSELGVGP